MCKDLESQFICQHIVNEFNERVIAFLPSTKLLLSFAYCFIYHLKPRDQGLDKDNDKDNIKDKDSFEQQQL